MRTPIWKVYIGSDAMEVPGDPLTNAVIGFGQSDVYIDNTNYTTYRLVVNKGQIANSYERYFKIKFDNSDTTTVTEAKLYFTGSLANGAHLRLRTSSTYAAPSRTLMSSDITRATFGYPGSSNEIVQSNPATWLNIPVHQEGNIYVTDYIIAQLVIDGNIISTLNVFNNLQFVLWYKEE